jgi:hypothetical protein
VKIIIICVLDINRPLGLHNLDFKNSWLNQNWFNQLSIKKHQVGWHLKYSQKLTSKKNSHKIYSFCVLGQKNPLCDIPWHKHTKPPKICNHKYNISVITLFGNVWTSYLELFLFVLSIFD